MRNAKTPARELVSDFFLAKTRLSDASRAEYQRYLGLYLDRSGDPLAEGITKESVEEFVAETRARTIYGARFACAVLKSFASWLADEGILRSDTGGSVLRDVKTPKVPREGRPAIDDADLERIWSALAQEPNSKRHRDRALIWLLFATGLRANEARELRLEDVHLITGKSWVYVRAETSKGNHSRQVRLGRLAADAIRRYIADGRVPFSDPGPEPLFTTEAGKGFKTGGFISWMARLSDLFEQHGVRDWKAHRMRHTWATWYHRSSRDTGLTVYDLKREGGWSDLNIPLRYTKDRPWDELTAMPTPIEAVLARRRSA